MALNQSALMGTTMYGTGILTPTALVVDTSLYTTGDCVAGVLSIPDFVREPGRLSRVEVVTLGCLAANTGLAFDLLFLNANIGATSTLTDQSAATIAAVDLAKWVDTLNIPANAYTLIGATAKARVAPVQMDIGPSSGTTMYCALVARSAPTYGALELSLAIKVLYL